MSQSAANQDTFASGRYSKRKRTQVVYCMEELEVDDSESDYEVPQLKKRRALATPRPLPKRSVFPFLRLPAEIRNIIYEYALVDPPGICFFSSTKHRRRAVRRVSPNTMVELMENYHSTQYNDLIKAGEEIVTLAPSLLCVSKQIFYESRDILYSNEFIFADTRAMYNFLINMGPMGAPLLKKVTLFNFMYGRGSKAYNHACFAVLAWATNLTKLTVDTQRGHYHSTKRLAEQIYRDAFPWLETVGNVQRKVDAAVDILHLNDECFEYFWGSSKSGDLKEFRDHLRKLLGAQQKRVIRTLVKRRRQGTKSMAAE